MRAILFLFLMLCLESRSNAGVGVSFIWATRLGGPDEDMGRSVAVDAGGNVFVCGHFVGTAEFGVATLRSPEGQAGFIARLDKTGSVQWAQQFGGHDGDDCRCIAVDLAGNCIVTGNFRSATSLGAARGQISLVSAGGTDILLAKYSGSGSLIWAKRAGGIGNDYGQAVAVDHRGNIYLTGSFEFVGTFDSVSLPGRDATQLYVAKYDPEGRLLWVKDISGGESATGLGIAVDEAGNSCVTGKFNPAKATFPPVLFSSITPSLKGDFFVSKYDPNGKNLWYQASGGPGNDQGHAVNFDKAGNIFAAGVFDTSIRFGTLTLTNSRNLGIFVVKYDSSGKLLWAAAPNGAYGGEALGVRSDAAGGVHLCGYFYGTAAFGQTTLHTAGNPDLFLAKYDSDGKILFAVQVGGSAVISPVGFTTDAEGHAFATGYFRSNAAIGNSFLPNAGGRDIFVSRIDVPPPLPRMSIERHAGGITIHWPDWAVGFQLEVALGLETPTKWLPSAENISVSANQFIFTNRLIGEAEFYRLRKP